MMRAEEEADPPAGMSQRKVHRTLEQDGATQHSGLLWTFYPAPMGSWDHPQTGQRDSTAL